MRAFKLLGVVAATALVFGTGGAVSAAPLQGTATLTVDILDVGQISFSGTGFLSVTASDFFVPSDLVNLQSAITVPVTATAGGLTVDSITALTGVRNLTSTFSLGGITNQVPGEVCPPTVPSPISGAACNVGGGLGGAMPLAGTIRVLLLGGGLSIPIQLDEANVGLGGPFSFGDSIALTGDAAAWTTGTGLLNTGTNVVATQGSSVTPDGGFNLVTPTYVATAGGIPLHMFTSFSFTPAVPEPGVLLLVAAGVAGLALGVPRRR